MSEPRENPAQIVRALLDKRINIDQAHERLRQIFHGLERLPIEADAQADIPWEPGANG